MWDEATKDWVADDQLVVLGVVQEQHAERTRLYKQWRQFEWPIVQDALNLLQIKVVPLAIAIDDDGIIASHRASPEFLRSWLEAPRGPVVVDDPPEPDAGLQSVRDEFLWNGQTGLDTAIGQYETLLKTSYAGNPAAHFEAAVAYRARFDTTGDPADFQKAIDLWSLALELDPNQYIYRRRIQQYGARLGKPYPFYDWIDQARTDIRERGETPEPLTVSLSGAEIASPVREFASDSKVDRSPDPDAEIQTDDTDLIGIGVVTVPAAVRPGQAVRVHVMLTPGENAKWNNEAEPTQLWIEQPANGQLSAQLLEGSLPEQGESIETRQFEFEVQLADDAAEPVTIDGYALYNVCITDTGQCVYLRAPVRFEIKPNSDGE